MDDASRLKDSGDRRVETVLDRAAGALASALARWPFMTLKVVGGIRVEGR